MEATGTGTAHVAFPGEHLAGLFLAEQVLASCPHLKGIRVNLEQWLCFKDKHKKNHFA